VVSDFGLEVIGGVCGLNGKVSYEYSVIVGTYLLYWWVGSQEGGSMVLCAWCEGRYPTALLKCCVGGVDD
jgi:hypothetical protein